MSVRTRGKDTPRTRPRLGDEARAFADRLFDEEAARAADDPPRRPGATYRLQVHRGFTLDDVTRIVDYLADLGVTDGYLSPYLSARPGSTHGYDVFDHRRINAEIGDRKAHDRLLLKLRDRGMGRVLDIVPNHMGVAGLNPFWSDLLETGPLSRYARYFDVDWSPQEDDLAGRVLLPILEDQYGRVLESGKLVLRRDGGRFFLAYHDRELPIAPRSYAAILEADDPALDRLGRDRPDVASLRSIAWSSRTLPGPDDRDAESARRLAGEKEVLKRRIARLADESPDVAATIDACVASFAGREGEPRSFDRLHALLESQVYRLSYWRVASEEINYRRFFDINDLAGLRTEDSRVFAETHARIFRWVDEGGVTALRVDHPDGLADPAGYFRRVQSSLFLRACRARFQAEPNPPADWPAIARRIGRRHGEATRREPGSRLARRFPVLVEKILTRDEPIPGTWAIDGTVGYEFLIAVNGLFVDPESAGSILATYHEFTGESTKLGEVLFDAKRLITRSSLASERNTLALRLARIAKADRRSRDFTRAELGRALGSIMATFPVYRTYLQPGEPTSRRDRSIIERAVALAGKRNPTIDPSVFDFVRRVLLMDHPEGLSPGQVKAREAFAVRFQQTTGPVQAKGLEDTSFYRYVPLISLNEVGGDPSRFGLDVAAFHEKNRRRLAEWPDGLLATATHDTKRGEDARTRIDALSEFPDEWKAGLARWSAANAGRKGETSRGQAPDPREEYFFYQALIGSLPSDEAGASSPEFVARIQEYMIKAAREAKVKTSWTDADPSHVDALKAFVHEVLAGPESRPFLDDFIPFARRVARVGVVHSLAQTLIKLTSPGVPDVYQGCELWDLSLVDPDNRRPVDFDARARLLAAIKGRLDGGEGRADLARSLIAKPDDGAIKLYLLWSALTLRRERPDLFRRGTYLPLTVTGPGANRVVAFARRDESGAVIAVAPRLVGRLMGDDGTRLPIGEAWGSTAVEIPDDLASTRWTDRLTGRVFEPGGRLGLAEAFATLPLALLESTG